MPALLGRNQDPAEAELEAAELNRYLLAKSLFDCREFDRCAAVFLPDSLLVGVLPTQPDDEGILSFPRIERATLAEGLPRLSQKSLFLALYARFMSGEKRKGEELDMVMGPHDVGNVTNPQLPVVSSCLQQWFDQITDEDGEYEGSQGWLEYL